LRRASKRVKVRAVTIVNELSLNEIRRLKRYTEIRHNNNLSADLMIVDDREIIIEVMEPSEGSPSNIWTNQRGWVNLIRQIYRDLWDHSTPLKERMRQLSSSER